MKATGLKIEIISEKLQELEKEMTQKENIHISANWSSSKFKYSLLN